MSSSGAAGHSSSSSSSSAAASGAGGSSAPSSSALVDGGAAKKRKGGGGGEKPESSVFVVTNHECSCYGEAVNDVIGVFSLAEDARGTARTLFFENCPNAFDGWVFKGDDNGAKAGDDDVAAAEAPPGGGMPKGMTESREASIVREVMITAYFDGRSGTEILFKGGRFDERWDDEDGTGRMWMTGNCCLGSNTMTVSYFSSVSLVQKVSPPKGALKELGKEGWSSKK